MQWYVGILLIGLGVLFYVLYDRGYMPVKSMSAIHFIGNMGAGINKASAAFGSATGQIRRVLRFKESNDMLLKRLPCRLPPCGCEG